MLFLFTFIKAKHESPTREIFVTGAKKDTGFLQVSFFSCNFARRI